MRTVRLSNGFCGEILETEMAKTEVDKQLESACKNVQAAIEKLSVLIIPEETTEVFKEEFQESIQRSLNALLDVRRWLK